MENKVKRLKSSYDGKIVYKTRLTEKLKNIDANIHKEIETLEQSLAQLKSLQNSKLLEKQNLEMHLKKRQEAFRLSELERQKIESEVEILRYEAQSLEQRYVDRVHKKEQLTRLLRDMDDVRESIRSTIGGFIGNMGDFRNKDLKHLIMKMEHEKESKGEKQKDKTPGAYHHQVPRGRDKSNSEAPKYRLTKGHGTNLGLGAQSNEEMIEEMFQVESQIIKDLMRRNTGVLGMDHDLLIEKYEKNYQEQLAKFAKANEQFNREVKSEVATVQKGRVAQYSDTNDQNN